MKKSILATILALMAVSAHADKSSVLKVRGTLIAPSCEILMSNNGVLDFGTVNANNLSSTEATQLGEQNLTLTIDCPVETKVGWSISDNRTDTNASSGSGSTLMVQNANERGTALRGSLATFGLGKTPDGKNIGAYSIFTSTSEVSANGSQVEPIRTAATAGAGMGRWQKAAGGNIANKDLGLMSIAKKGSTNPVAVKRVTFPLNIALAVESLKKLKLTEDTEFDGQATISVVYL